MIIFNLIPFSWLKITTHQCVAVNLFLCIKYMIHINNNYTIPCFCQWIKQNWFFLIMNIIQVKSYRLPFDFTFTLSVLQWFHWFPFILLIALNWKYKVSFQQIDAAGIPKIPTPLFHKYSIWTRGNIMTLISLGR